MGVFGAYQIDIPENNFYTFFWVFKIFKILDRYNHKKLTWLEAIALVHRFFVHFFKNTNIRSNNLLSIYAYFQIGFMWSLPNRYPAK